MEDLEIVKLLEEYSNKQLPNGADYCEVRIAGSGWILLDVNKWSGCETFHVGDFKYASVIRNTPEVHPFLSQLKYNCKCAIMESYK